MNIYLATSIHASYDEYQAWVVYATTAEEALTLIRNSEHDTNLLPHNLTPERVRIRDIGRTTANQPAIIYKDFNAG